MAKQRKMVPFGYEEEKERIKGTVFILDSFNDIAIEPFKAMIQYLEKRSFAKVVLYPFHGETLKRMGLEEEDVYYKRVNQLENVMESFKNVITITIEEWEGKRKKYTPLDTSLQFLTDKYKAPYFLLISSEIANRFATYSQFDDWIREIRLIIMADSNVQLHPKLLRFENRIETISLHF